MRFETTKSGTEDLVMWIRMEKSKITIRRSNLSGSGS